MNPTINIDKDNLPTHIAVIMDGNGRWAKGKGAARIFGHKNAIEAVRDVTEGCAELGVKYLTLYAFSTENWARPKTEVKGLMQLLVHTIKAEIGTLQKNDVKLNAIGDLSSLPNNCQNELAEAIELTKQNKGLVLTLALSYSGRWEILEATKSIAKAVQSGEIQIDEIDTELFRSNLMSKNIPDPELLIRTSGEMRISNFLLWQLAYTEIYITQKLWPDFRKNDLNEAILAYQRRERRFGQISEQVN
ncbi:isoprenyl transferase [Fulvivirga lutea]|uniref:Isoprenyl transferase n=1 Tax=Fulvivirga lutea TaxID=2810512 RepID=A0A974WIL5_9BACT|nr:isoprenyl transferase [Fulvivirga lutea]QSE98584.1 isoprenyl transferase [Fulvivirga lutea]